MRITLACVGKMKASPEKELADKYVRQLPWPLDIREIDIKKPLPIQQRKQQEANALLAVCHTADKIIALDERGKSLRSEAFATRIGDWQQSGLSHLALIIGGQDGLNDSVRQRADLVLSFGGQTWPHMLVRAMLCEQLYRAYTILSGHPYHRR